MRALAWGVLGTAAAFALATVVAWALRPDAVTFGLVIVVLSMSLGAGLLLASATAAVHALVRHDLGLFQRVAWLAIVVLLPFGSLAYFALGRARTAGLLRGP